MCVCGATAFGTGTVLVEEGYCRAGGGQSSDHHKEGLHIRKDYSIRGPSVQNKDV